MKEPTLGAFQRAIRAAHGCRSELRERTPVRLVLEKETVWEGEVLVFDLIGHPTALTCYAWAEGEEVRAVLHEGHVTSPQVAVLSMAPRSGQ